MENQQEFNQLYFNYVSNTISPEEMDRFFLLIREAGYSEEWLQQLLDRQWDGLLENVEVERPVIIPMYRKGWFRVAAAVLLLLGGGLWWFNDRPKGSEPTIVVAATDLPPGTNKAVLTLDNGRQIILDDVTTGAIAEQGGVEIAKTGDGQLAYNPSGNKLEIAYNTLTTPRGGQHHVRLEDGTEVWLNAASSIRFPTAFTGKEKIVEITGEAYFKVVHRKDKPFQVRVNGVEVQVLGTEFNVNGYADEQVTQTTLLQGVVKVGGIILRPGQQAQASDMQGLKVVEAADTSQVVAWKNGYFAFQHTNLSDVMRQLSRWYNVDVVYEGKVADRYFGGNISRKSTALEALKILEESNVHFRIEKQRIIVMP